MNLFAILSYIRDFITKVRGILSYSPILSYSTLLSLSPPSTVNLQCSIPPLTLTRETQLHALTPSILCRPRKGSLHTATIRAPVQNILNTSLDKRRVYASGTEKLTIRVDSAGANGNIVPLFEDSRCAILRTFGLELPIGLYAVPDSGTVSGHGAFDT